MDGRTKGGMEEGTRKEGREGGKVGRTDGRTEGGKKERKEPYHSCILFLCRDHIPS